MQPIFEIGHVLESNCQGKFCAHHANKANTRVYIFLTSQWCFLIQEKFAEEGNCPKCKYYPSE